MISFASPALAVAGAACVAVPVLLHLLLRRRRTPVEWAAMDLLREALRRTERRRRVERWLLLAVRTMVVAAAAAAIAAPFLGQAETGTGMPRTLVVVIDDGIASAERLEDGTALERSVRMARSRIDALSEGDRVAVVLASRPGLGADAPASLDRRAALQRLDAVESSERAADMAAALATAGAIVSMPESEGTERIVLVASAFREGTLASMPALGTLGTPERPVRLDAEDAPPAVGGNLRITALETDRVAGAGPDAPASVRVTVTRDRGDGTAEAVLRVSGPTLTAAAERPISLAAGERERTVVLQLSERPSVGAVDPRRSVLATLSADAQPMDDGRAAVLASVDRLRAVVVDRRQFGIDAGVDRLPAGEWVARALAPSDVSAIDVVNVDPAAFDGRSLAGADLAVLAQPQLLSATQWEVLDAFVLRGGTLAVLPPASERVQAWMAAFIDRIRAPWTAALEAVTLDPPDSLTADRPGGGMLRALAPEVPLLAPSVDVVRIVPVQVGSDSTAVQLRTASGAPVLLEWRPREARGTVLLFTCAIDPMWTSLPLKPLMVPMWQEMASESRRRSGAERSVRVGAVPMVDMPGVSELRPVAADGGALPGARTIPVTAGGRAAEAVSQAGLLELVDTQGVVRGVMAAVIDVDAASVREVDPDRVRAWLSTSGARINVEAVRAPVDDRTSAGTARTPLDPGALAPWLFALASALAILEAWVARRASHAVRPRSSPS